MMFPYLIKFLHRKQNTNASLHRYLKFPPVKVRITEPPGQTEAGLAVIEVAAVEFVFTVTEVLTQLVVLQLF